MMRLQHQDPDTALTVNAHPFGQELSELLWSERLLDVLDGPGWLDGGCLILANAVDIWSRSILKPIAWVWKDDTLSDGVRASHYAMAYDLGDGELAILDGNGLGTLADFEASMRFEHENHSHQGAGYVQLDAAKLYQDACQGRRPEEEANIYPGDTRGFLVFKELNRAFGRFEEDRILLAWPEPDDAPVVQRQKSS